MTQALIEPELENTQIIEKGTIQKLNEDPQDTEKPIISELLTEG